MGASAHIFRESFMPFSYHTQAPEGSARLMTSLENRSIRILLVEEESLVRTALQKLLESWPQYEVVGEAGSKNETLEMLERLDPDVILLTLPGDESEGLEVVRELAQASERAQLLVLMGDSEPGLAVQVVRLGARGVVRKKRAADELRRAIQKVHEGKEIWLDRTSLASLITVGEALGRERVGNLSLLTEREREVVSLVTKGFKNKEVGERLFISETTVRHHLTTIFDKLKVRNRFELISHLHRHRFSTSKETARSARSARSRKLSGRRPS
jgi:DNA-binding NarL/FixJ family response regulator